MNLSNVSTLILARSYHPASLFFITGSYCSTFNPFVELLKVSQDTRSLILVHKALDFLRRYAPEVAIHPLMLASCLSDKISNQIPTELLLSDFHINENDDQFQTTANHFLECDINDDNVEVLIETISKLVQNKN